MLRFSTGGAVDEEGALVVEGDAREAKSKLDEMSGRGCGAWLHGLGKTPISYETMKPD